MDKSKNESKNEPKDKSKKESKKEQKDESKSEPKDKAKSESKDESKGESKLSVLLLEDDVALAEQTAEYLRMHSYAVSVAHTAEQFFKLWKGKAHDVILLDIMVGKTDGLTICREIRRDSSVPIIFLTALGEESDIIVGLEVGADDYLVKPFSPRELLARIKTLMRRVQGADTDFYPARKETIQFGEWVLDTRSHLLLDREGLAVSLSSSQFRLLSFFLSHPGESLDRDSLLNCLDIAFNDESLQHRLDVQISRLRTSLGDSEQKYIRTVRNVGYMFIMPVKKN